MTPGQPDTAVIGRHLAALDEVLQRLRAHQSCTQQELAADGDRRWAVERGLQLCVQNALDIATHRPVPRKFAGRNSVLPKGLYT